MIAVSSRAGRSRQFEDRYGIKRHGSAAGTKKDGLSGAWAGDHLLQAHRVLRRATIGAGPGQTRCLLDDRVGFHVKQSGIKPTAGLVTPKTGIGIADPVVSPTAGGQELIGRLVIQRGERPVV